MTVLLARGNGLEKHVLWGPIIIHTDVACDKKHVGRVAEITFEMVLRLL